MRMYRHINGALGHVSSSSVLPTEALVRLPRRDPAFHLPQPADMEGDALGVSKGDVLGRSHRAKTGV